MSCCSSEERFILAMFIAGIIGVAVVVAHEVWGPCHDQVNAGGRCMNVRQRLVVDGHVAVCKCKEGP